MIRTRLLPIAAIVLAGLSLGSGCPTVPKIEDRVIELAAGGSTSQEFPAVGVINVYNGTASYDLGQEIDLAGIIDHAGIDLDKVQDVKLAGISYRCVVPDPASGRSINNGNVTAARGNGAPVALITNFNVNVSSVQGWTKATVSAPGVTLINGMLTDILASVKNGTPVSNGQITYSVSGTSNPQGVTSNFTWAIKLDLTVKGTVKIKVLN